MEREIRDGSRERNLSWRDENDGDACAIEIAGQFIVNFTRMNIFFFLTSR